MEYIINIDKYICYFLGWCLIKLFINNIINIYGIYIYKLLSKY